jgi:hypothetical protein
MSRGLKLFFLEGDGSARRRNPTAAKPTNAPCSVRKRVLKKRMVWRKKRKRVRTMMKM